MSIDDKDYQINTGGKSTGQSGNTSGQRDHSNNGLSGTDSSSSDNLKHQAKSSAEDVGKSLDKEARNVAEESKQDIGDEAQTASSALEAAAEELRHNNASTVADYVSTVATQVSDLGQSLKSKSVDELLHDAQTLARENPALTFIGSVAIGLAAARLFKADSNAVNQGRLEGGYGARPTGYGQSTPQQLTHSKATIRR